MIRPKVGLHVRVGSNISHSYPTSEMRKYVGAVATIKSKESVAVQLIFDNPGLQQCQDMECNWYWSPKDLELVEEGEVND